MLRSWLFLMQRFRYCTLKPIFSVPMPRFENSSCALVWVVYAKRTLVDSISLRGLAITLFHRNVWLRPTDMMNVVKFWCASFVASSKWIFCVIVTDMYACTHRWKPIRGITNWFVFASVKNKDSITEINRLVNMVILQSLQSIDYQALI